MTAKRTALPTDISLALLTFETSRGDALDEEALEDDEEQKTGTSASDGHREERAPVGLACRVDEAAQPELHGVVG